jgi:hypothetical protein
LAEILYLGENGEGPTDMLCEIEADPADESQFSMRNGGAVWQMLEIRGELLK